MTWGSTAAERQEPLPGDDLVSQCDVQAERAISIAAPAEAIWPWLVQIGQDRAGFYSYEVLENMIGCQIEGVSELRPEWAQRRVGDMVRLAPEMALEVAVAEPPYALVLAAGDVEGGESRPQVAYGEGGDLPGMPVAFTWAFVVTELGDGISRLHLRERYRFTEKDRLSGALVPLASAFMTQKMLRTIRDLAQRG